MTYEQAIDRILERADMNNVSNGEALARTFFYDAMAALSEKPEWTQNDLRDYFLRITYSVPSGATYVTNALLCTAISGTNCIDKVLDIFDSSNEFLFNKCTLEDVKTWSYSGMSVPSGNEIGWYQIGDKIYFIPAATISEKSILLIIKLKTRIFASSGVTSATPGAVDRKLLDADELNALYSDQFIIACIDMAVEFMKKSVEYNR